MPKQSNESPVRPWQKPKAAHSGRIKPNSHVYNTVRWRKDRALHLQDNPLCAHCYAIGIITEATVSDHVNPINNGGDMWDWANRQALCKRCHNIKSGKERHTGVGG